MPGPLSDPVRICLVGVSNFAQSHSGSIQRMVEEGLAILGLAEAAYRSAKSGRRESI